MDVFDRERQILRNAGWRFDEIETFINQTAHRILEAQKREQDRRSRFNQQDAA